MGIPLPVAGQSIACTVCRMSQQIICTKLSIFIITIPPLLFMQMMMLIILIVVICPSPLQRRIVHFRMENCISTAKLLINQSFSVSTDAKRWDAQTKSVTLAERIIKDTTMAIFHICDKERADYLFHCPNVNQSGTEWPSFEIWLAGQQYFNELPKPTTVPVPWFLVAQLKTAPPPPHSKPQLK